MDVFFSSGHAAASVSFERTPCFALCWLLGALLVATPSHPPVDGDQDSAITGSDGRFWLCPLPAAGRARRPAIRAPMGVWLATGHARARRPPATTPAPGTDGARQGSRLSPAPASPRSEL